MPAAQTQIQEALKRAKWKKALYFYDDQGYRKRLGVFSKKKSIEIKRYLRDKKLIQRLSEFDVKTDMPDTPLKNE
ncbi:hypothetical protein KGY73_00455 [bacterium]|nr:hypothetical protein [bacterium]